MSLISAKGYIEWNGVKKIKGKAINIKVGVTSDLKDHFWS